MKDMHGPRTEGFPGDSICFKIQTLKVIDERVFDPLPFRLGKMPNLNITECPNDL